MYSNTNVMQNKTFSDKIMEKGLFFGLLYFSCDKNVLQSPTKSNSVIFSLFNELLSLEFLAKYLFPDINRRFNIFYYVMLVYCTSYPYTTKTPTKYFYVPTWDKFC